MSRPYKEVKAGEPILAQDWNTIQSQIHEHILTHTHTGTGEAGAKIDVDIRALAAAADMSVRKLNAGEGLTVGSASQPLLAVNPAATNQEGNYHVNVAGTLRAEQVRTGRLDGVTSLAVGDLAISGSAGIGTSAPGDFKLKVGGDTYVGGALTVERTTNLNAGLTVTGTTLLNGPLTTGRAAAESLEILGTVSAGGVANLNGGLGVTGSSTLNGSLSVTGNSTLSGDLSISPRGKLSFGEQVRQMINLWREAYGIGVQNGTQYFRTDKNFAWYKQGTHDNGELSAGTGGLVQMVIKDGAVGIGTHDPTGNRLKVQGGATYLDGTLTATGAASMNNGLAVTGNTTLNGSVGIGAPIPASRLHIDNGRVDITTSDDNVGGQNRFDGLTAWNATTAYRRAQLVLSSSYSDLVIASCKANDNHGSTLTFVTSNPADASQYRKWVINQGNWGNRKQFLDFGYSDTNGRANPHDSISGAETVFTLDGVNKRVGIGATSPSAKLEVAGAVIVGTLKIGTGVQVDRFDDGALGNSSTTIPTAKAVRAYVDAQIAQLKGVFDKHQHKYVHYTYRDIVNVNVHNVSDTQAPNPT